MFSCVESIKNLNLYYFIILLNFNQTNLIEMAFICKHNLFMHLNVCVCVFFFLILLLFLKLTVNWLTYVNVTCRRNRK